VFYNSSVVAYIMGTRWRSWFRHCATSRNVADSITICQIKFSSTTFVEKYQRTSVWNAVAIQPSVLYL